VDPLRTAGPLGPVDGAVRPAPAQPRRTATGQSFADVLGARLNGGLTFSGHAKERIARRGIDLDAPALDRLQGGVDRAAAKGSRESLVLVDDTAFVVSVRNRTVVTAVDREHMRDHVFTNIDSAVIA
jgi:flagellar operon protein